MTQNTIQLDKEANALMLELSKGLSSPSMGEQSRAIAQFPYLIEKYPFPSVINSILLRLIDIFRDGNNYHRMCILRSILSCNVHINNSSLSDVIVSNLLPLTQSNDPASRALVLRFFGVLSSNLKNYTNVHHAIITQIDSHYEVEYDAAVWASHRFASISAEFSHSLCGILTKHLNDWTMESYKQSKLIPLACYMYHSLDLMTNVKESLIKILETRSSQKFIILSLQALNELELNLPLHAYEHISLVIETISLKSSDEYIDQMYACLQKLAAQVTHHWKKNHIESLCKLFLATDKLIDKFHILKTFKLLIEESFSMEIFSGTQTKYIIMQASLLNNHEPNIHSSDLIGKAVETSLRFLEESTDHVAMENPTCFTLWEVQTLLKLKLFSFKTGEIPWYLNPNTGCSLEVLHTLFSEILENVKSSEDLRNQIPFEYFLQMPILKTPQYELVIAFVNELACIKSFNPDYAKTMRKVCLDLIQSVSGEENESLVFKFISLLCNVVSCCVDSSLSEVESSSLLKCLMKKSKQQVNEFQLNPWISYKLAKLLSCLGHHSLAKIIYSKILEQLALSMEQRDWIKFLDKFSEAFSLITIILGSKSDKDRDFLECSAEEFEKTSFIALDAVKKLITNETNSWFGVRYAQLWTNIFKTISHVSLNFVYIRAFTKNILATVQCCLISKMNCLEKITCVSQEITHLISRSLDADDSSIDCLKSLACWTEMLKNLLVEFQEKLSFSSTPGFLDSHTNEILLRLSGLIRLLITGSTYRWPKFLFKQIQITCVQLIVTPKPYRTGDAISVNPEVNQMIQIMGVIRQTCLSERAPLRTVSGTQVSLRVFECEKPVLTNPLSTIGSSLNKFNSAGEFLMKFVQNVEIISDEYFNAEFCVKMEEIISKISVVKNLSNNTRYFMLQPSVKLIDTNGQSWIPEKTSLDLEEIILRIDF